MVARKECLCQALAKGALNTKGAEDPEVQRPDNIFPSQPWDTALVEVKRYFDLHAAIYRFAAGTN